MYKTAGEDIAVVIRFLVGGDTVVPDAGSVSYSVRDNAGALMVGLSAVAVADPYSTQTTITVPAASNAITGQIEKRAVIVRFTKDSIPHEIVEIYKLTAWLNLDVAPSAVRASLGLNEGELPDAEIDLPAAYFAIINEPEIDPVDFDAALAAGNASQIAANEAVVCRAALRVLPTLQTRMAAQERSGTSSFARQPVDYPRLRADLIARYSQALADALGIDSEAPTMIVFSTQTDPFTGEDA